MVAKQHSLFMLGGAVWLALVGVGLWQLSIYKRTPGTVVAVLKDWPRGSTVPQSPTLPTLVMAVHPHCPCTRASISELARLLGQCQGRVQAEVLFLLPAGSPVGWEKTDSWKAAAALPGVRVRTDRDGVEAARFGAETSGQCFLFAPDGRRLFTGGITPARGHEGDNSGRDTIVSLIMRGTQRTEKTPVFGCPLLSSL